MNDNSHNVVRLLYSKATDHYNHSRNLFHLESLYENKATSKQAQQGC